MTLDSTALMRISRFEYRAIDDGLIKPILQEYIAKKTVGSVIYPQKHHLPAKVQVLPLFA